MSLSAFCPCYGMAETCLLASSGPADKVEPTILRVLSTSLSIGSAIRLADADSLSAVELVGHGAAAIGAEVRAVHPETLAHLSEGSVGELWLASTSLALGYYGKDEQTQHSFGTFVDGNERRWYRTGDLGFLLEGEVFVCGRIKDLMIFAGKNHYPQDIELTAEEADGRLRPGCIAAFSIPADDAQEGELLVVVAELRDKATSADDCARVAHNVKLAISTSHSVQCHEVGRLLS